MTPTQRTLRMLREAGYDATVVEKWNAHARVRIDLWGFVDILAVSKSDGHELCVQCTSGSNGAARVTKANEILLAKPYLRHESRRFAVWAWRKLKSGWAPKVVEL